MFFPFRTTQRRSCKPLVTGPRRNRQNAPRSGRRQNDSVRFFLLSAACFRLKVCSSCPLRCRDDTKEEIIRRGEALCERPWRAGEGGDAYQMERVTSFSCRDVFCPPRPFGNRQTCSWQTPCPDFDTATKFNRRKTRTIPQGTR